MATVIQLAEKVSTDALKEYSRYVAYSRAIPHLDLKPVQRRLLWCLLKIGARNFKGFKKTSSAVAETMKIHPHGDASIEGAIGTLVNSPNALISGRGNWGCLEENTEIPLCDGTKIPIKDLVGKDEFWVYSCKPDGKIVPGRGHSARLTKVVNYIFEITLDNGNIIKCTDNHPFMLRSGKFMETKDLKEGQSLMPFNSRINKFGYLEIQQNDSLKHAKFHRLMGYLHLKGQISKAWKEIKNNNKSDKFLVIHHKDCNKLNNDPSNLQWMGSREHWILHNEQLDGFDYFREQTIKRNKSGDMQTSEIRELRGKRISKTLQRLSKEGKLYFQSEECREITRQRNLTNNPAKTPEAREKISKASSKNNKIAAINGVHPWQTKKHRDYCKKRMIDLAKRGLHPGQINSQIDNPFKGGNFKNYGNHKRWHTGSIEECKSCGYNHKISKIRKIFLKNPIPVYDITVDEYNNFALESGVFVHNSIWGDPIAAPRYTDVRTSEIFELLIDDFSNKLIDYVETYDGDDKEPVLLPFKLPPILLIDMLGIGVGLMTSIPALHISTVKESIKQSINASMPDPKIEYSYRGARHGNTLYPIYNKDIQKGQFIVTELPNTITTKSLFENITFKELMKSKHIKFYDESEIKEINGIVENDLRLIFETTEFIFHKFILKFLCRSFSETFYYITHKVKRSRSEFLKDWRNWRVGYLQKKDLVGVLDFNIKCLKQNVFNEISVIKKTVDNYPDFVDDSVKNNYKLFLSSFPPDFQKSSALFNLQIPNQKDIYSSVMSSPISSIKKKKSLSYKQVKIKKISEVHAKIIDEIDNIPDSSFNSKTKIYIPKVVNEEVINKFVTFKDHKVVVSYKPIPRVKCFETKQVILFTEEGKFSYLNSFDVGEYIQIGESRIVGFGVIENPIVFITMDNRVCVKTRGFKLNADLKLVFPLTDEIKTNKGIVKKADFLREYNRSLKSMAYDWIYYI